MTFSGDGELAFPGDVDVNVRVLETGKLKESGYMRRLRRRMYLHPRFHSGLLRLAAPRRLIALLER